MKLKKGGVVRVKLKNKKLTFDFFKAKETKRSISSKNDKFPELVES